jgi:tetratricopeptide (TPR) repeat protein
MAAAPPLRTRVLEAAATVVAVALVYVAAVGVRWSISTTMETALRPPGADELPYTRESALLFHYADVYRTTGRIPRVDERAEVPEGLQVRRELSVGKGIVAAWLYNGFGVHAMSFQRFVRRFDAAWYSLGVIPLFFLVRGRTRSLLAAALSAMLLAWTVGAMQRSTGLGFARENFALPLIFAHVWLFDMGLRRGRLGPSIAAGIVLAVALATWDLTQLYLLLVVAYCAARCLVRRAWASKLVHLAPTLAAGVIAGLLVPYLRAHAFLVTYGMLAGYGLMAWWLAEKRVRMAGPIAKAVLAALLVGTLAASWLLPAGKTYGHFRELFFAKLRYLNDKPDDPAKLSYDARILWTPALHSATTTNLGRPPIRSFTAVFWLTAIAAIVVAAAKLRRRDIGEVSLFAAMLVAWLVLYVLFVRMQVFLIFFIAAFAGIGAGALRAFGRRWWTVLPAALVIGMFLLADLTKTVYLGRTSDQRQQLYERPSDEDPYEYVHLVSLANVYGQRFQYAAAQVVIEWLRQETPADAVVLADFPLEPTLYVYGDRSIVLHPKFESVAMRDKVRQFFESFYAPSERMFYEYCRRNGVRYFVADSGMFGGPGSRYWVYSPRYIAGSTGETLGGIGTRWMYENPDRCRYFRFRIEVGAEGERVWAYRVFELVTEADIKEALFLADRGTNARDRYVATREREDLEIAAEFVDRAVKLWPGCYDAWLTMANVYGLLGNDERALEARSWCEQIAQQEQQQQQQP